MKRNPQGKRWRRLDNTGKIFPLIANENLSNVFRVSATLKEDIQPAILQQALEDVLPQFEDFRVKLKRGFFWYYLEQNNRTPELKEKQHTRANLLIPKATRCFYSGSVILKDESILKCSMRSRMD